MFGFGSKNVYYKMIIVKQINYKRELLKFCAWNDIGHIVHLPLCVGSIGRFSPFIETI